MTALDHLLDLAHLAAALGTAVGIAMVGRRAARRAHQPEVIGEIMAGLLVGPVLVRLLGERCPCRKSHPSWWELVYGGLEHGRSDGCSGRLGITWA
jgi:Kef-type K+ transport system membrane component KefB